MYSFWEKEFWFDEYDVAFIGSGLVGLFSSIFYKQARPESRVVVIERAAVPAGASTKNAGFACFGTAGEIISDLETMTEEEIISTVDLRWRGLTMMKDMIPSALIDYSVKGGYEVFTSEAAFLSAKANLAKVNYILEKATGVTQVISTCDITNKSLHRQGFYNSLEAQLNPVKLVKQLIKQARQLGVEFHFGLEVDSFVTQSDKVELELSRGQISLSAMKVVFTNNAFANQFFPSLDIQPYRNQVLISKPVSNLQLDGCYHYDAGYVYFRNVGKRLLIGGARNLDMATEATSDLGTNIKLIEYLLDFANRKIHPEGIEIETSWSGIIATGQSKMPIILEVEQHIYLAARLGGMGVATGVAVGKQTAELLCK